MQHDSLVKLTFLELTRGALHLFSFKTAVGLPSNLVIDVVFALVEILGESPCADDSDVWAGYVLLFPRLVEIRHGDPCEPQPNPRLRYVSRVASETHEHRRLLNNARELYQEQSRNLQA